MPPDYVRGAARDLDLRRQLGEQVIWFCLNPLDRELKRVYDTVQAIADNRLLELEKL